MPLVSRTRATLRSAEFGFFGVVVYTRVQTPRRWGAARRFLRPWPDLRPGVETLRLGLTRPLRTSWLMLGMRAAMLAAVHGHPVPRTLVDQLRASRSRTCSQRPANRADLDRVFGPQPRR